MDSLQFLPASVNATYRRLLDRISDEEFVFKVLSWIYHARHPLSMSELREALNIEPGDKTLNRNLISAEALVESCQGLVIWEQSLSDTADLDGIYSKDPYPPEEWEGSKDPGDSGSVDDVSEEQGYLSEERDGPVRLLHSTVKEFLDNEMRHKLRPQNYITQICLTYLNFDEFEIEITSFGFFWPKYEFPDFKFAVFAAESWHLYMRGDGETDRQLQAYLWTLLASRAKREFMCKMQSRFVPHQTFLHIIAQSGLISVYNSLLSAGTEGRLTYLKSRIMEPRPKDLDMLLAEMDNVSARDGDGMTPMHCAIKYGHMEFVKLLVTSGAEVNVADMFGRTVLHYAALDGEWEMVKWLVEHGADVENKDNFRRRVLLDVAVKEEWEVVKWLVERGADIEVTDGHGQTVLHEAAKIGQWGMMRWLIEHGADIEARDKGKRTPLDIAKAYSSDAEVLIFGLFH